MNDDNDNQRPSLDQKIMIAAIAATPLIDKVVDAAGALFGARGDQSEVQEK